MGTSDGNGKSTYSPPWDTQAGKGPYDLRERSQNGAGPPCAQQGLSPEEYYMLLGFSPMGCGLWD